MKVFKTTTLSLEEQDITIQPNETYNGVMLSFSECDGSHDSGVLYLNEFELEALITSLREMMNYVKS
jgi:hypothetical protein